MFVTQCVISIFKQEVGHIVHARQAMQFSTRERAEIEAEDVRGLSYVE
jgi:plasmid stabilization system protein ParE